MKIPSLTRTRIASAYAPGAGVGPPGGASGSGGGFGDDGGSGSGGGSGAIGVSGGWGGFGGWVSMARGSLPRGGFRGRARELVLERGLDRLHHHHLTADDKAPDGTPLFKSRLGGIGEVVPIEGLDRVQPGKQYGFFCSLHPGMRGTLIVR